MAGPLFVRTLAARETRRLCQLVRSSGDARMVRRAQVIRLSSHGMPPSEIAGILERSCSGVRKIINRFNVEGFASLADKPREGRPSKATDRYVAMLKEMVQVNSRDLGYPFSCWTLERLRTHLARKTRIVLSVAHLSRVMRDNGFVYRRPKHGMGHLRDPEEYNEKKAFLEFVKRGPRVQEPPSICCSSMNVRFTSIRP